MSTIVKAGVLYNSNQLPHYARGDTLIEKVAFTLSQVDELLQMFVHDHALPAAKKLGYQVEERKGITEFDYSRGYETFQRVLELRKEGFPNKNEKLLVIVKPNNVSVRHETPAGIVKASEQSIILDNPTFSLIETIQNYEEKNK